MAQALSHFEAITAKNGLGNIYVFPEPKLSSDNPHIPEGVSITIWCNPEHPAIAWSDNGYYKIKAYSSYADCWIRGSQLTGSPNPVYVTTPDPCTPPASVALNTEAKVLTASGGAGGDLNIFTGYQYSYRDRLAAAGAAWGAWSGAVTLGIGAASSLAVIAPPGYARQFRIRTTGSAGEGYYSGWTECATLLYGNTAPSAPTILLPASGAGAVCATPTIKVSCPAEPDGGAQTLRRRIDGGQWFNVYSAAAWSGIRFDVLPTLAAGSHTVVYQLMDEHGAVSGEASITFTVAPATWARAIAAGTVIANQSISHRADISELLAAVNAVRSFYGLQPASLPGVVGTFAAWRAQMQAIQAGLSQAYAAVGRAAPVWANVPAYPTATVVNELRARLI